MKMGKYLRLFDRSWLWRNFRLFRGRRIGRVARLRLFSPAVRQPLLLELIFPKPGEELLLFADPLFDSLFFEKRADFFFGALFEGWRGPGSEFYDFDLWSRRLLFLFGSRFWLTFFGLFGRLLFLEAVVKILNFEIAGLFSRFFRDRRFVPQRF
jgi:hypothetical protein